VPGVTNRMLSHITRHVLEGFPGSFPARRHAVHVGNPVRRGIAELPPPEKRFAGRSAPARLLILGGSQGARVLNEQVPPAVALLSAAKRPEVWHQTGAADADAVTARYRDSSVAAKVTPFIDDMAAAYAWADLVVCRSGALTIAELAAAGLGSILVPFAAAVDDHQTRNAALLVDCGAARLLPQSQANAESLARQLGEVLAKRSTLLTMAKQARQRAMPDAAEQVAAVCLAAGGFS
jgi:UDP-N-acetylglucosamine--N-acetylmuramyl-(pentapeptide) pyrophosphoryl-undecaprenol N-acetylglucosamine transferase